MTNLLTTIRKIIRQETAQLRLTEVGVVTELFSHESESDKNNYECTVKLRDSGLILKNVAVATARIGSAALPNKNDLVLVNFINGSIHAPVIVGRLYNDEDRPPVAKPHEFVYVSPDDAESGIRRIYLEFPKGNKILLDDDKLVVEAGSTKITVNNGGDVSMEVAGNMSVQAGGDIELGAKGNIILEAKGDVNVDGVNVNIKGKAAANVEASGSAKLKGATVAVNGMTSSGP
ncbi:MAG: Rhs element Vgr protein [bacterium]|nr:Rhs element Vgr protein [bacterium]